MNNLTDTEATDFPPIEASLVGHENVGDLQDLREREGVYICNSSCSWAVVCRIK